ncbi:SDR family oxidoreductase [Leucobacter sp. UT-8R-CII-1-4]|uniref:SDR family NAD(P)-dependent oxidoreductase n=1 Tax=Leucobacter sp. UT-8R-CII-1-4 TaxID=3040075 RepID=UPI0024A7C235|nr:SDR family oxidoreductase [Leucobacter sp. UT-8R-CII-1-4]MDI6023682.1 SDR family oxidoreductase [Leucobacter sp. UT-8R-CII-1-4]
MSNEFSGLAAIVTGGASGIGAAIVARLRAGGARVAILDRNIVAVANDVPAFQADISDAEQVQAAVEAAAERLGGIDIVVNNAGIGAQGTIEGNDEAEWHRVFDINVLGLVRVSRAAMPWLRASPHAAIVNTSSVLAIVGVPNRALYGATKGAVSSLSLQMAADHMAEGIRVNAVLPGTADTPWIQNLMDQADDPAAERAALEARQPHGRLVKAEEVAEAIAYLAGPLAGSTTGTTLVVDGGLSGLRLPAKS